MSAPVARSERRTADPEQAHDWFRQAYTEHTPRLSGDRANFRMRMASESVGLFRIDELVHSMTLDAQVDPYRAVVVARPGAGHMWAHCRSGEFEQGPGGLLLCDPHRPSRVGWSPIALQVVRIELEPVQKVAEAVSGVPAEQVRFEPSRSRGEGPTRYWLALVDRARAVLADDEVAGVPLVRAELLRALSTAALLTFPNNAADALTERPPPGTLHAEPAVIRRAVEFIDANADRPIGVDDIAGAARISPRALQAAFRRHRNVTPLEYLKYVRMDYAHRDLQRADPTRGETVVAVAARWGFTNPGRFAVEYRQRYGCSPSQTLRA